MANIQEVKILLGGMDKDNSIETINQYDYIDAHNIRNTGVEGSDANYTTNLEGTQLVTTSLPLGQNRGVGGARFETVAKAYRVVYNSNGYHQIRELDYNSNQEIVIFENLTDSNGVDILPITANTFFCDVRLMHERFLILNDGVNPIYFIDVDLFKQGGFIVRESDILLERQPPHFAPNVLYVNNTTKTTNALRGNLFQFRTQYGFADFRTSAWSTVSQREVPINEPASGQGQSVASGNGLRISINIGDESVKVLNIGARIGLGNWLLIKTLTRDYIKTLPNTDITVDGNNNLTQTTYSEAYNPTTNEYIFIFYNDGLYPVIDQVEVENPYDAVPLKAETVEVINGNLLAIGGLTSGYDRPELTDVNIGISEYAPNITSTVSGGTDFDFSHTSRFMGYRWFIFKGTPKQGDVLHFRFKSSGATTWNLYTYTVTQTDELNGIEATLTNFGNSIRANSGYPFIQLTTDGQIGMYSMFFLDSPTGNQDSEMYVVRRNIGTLSTQSINTLKTNSSYQLALAYFDKYGRYFPIVTDQRFVINTRSLTETLGNLTQINWNIQEDAPEGAYSYQWLISENQKYQKSIYLTGKVDGDETDENYIGFEMKSLERFLSNEKESQINYSFTKGDKVILNYTTNGANNTPVDWFRFPFVELDIVDFIVKENPAVAGDIKYVLKVRRTDILNKSGNIDYLNGKDIMMELYTPKKRDISQESLLFYEIGETYLVQDGKHSVTSGSIREGDWFMRGRLYESTITDNVPILYIIEDPNFSDNYVSNFWSAGRARTYNDEVGRVEQQASIRYSDEYVLGSKYNGISRYYLERIYGEKGGETTSKYGAIKKLEMRDSWLVCIQEFKVGVIPVYTSIWYDNTGKDTVAVSDKIFGSVQYRTGNYGCGQSKESIAVSRDLVIYFIDDNNCVPVRDSLSGLDVIDVNMTHYFIEHIRNAKANGSKLIGYFDDLNNEYNVTTEDVRGRTVTLDYGSAILTDQGTINYNLISGLTASNGTLTRIERNVTYTPNNNFVGSDVIVVTYNGSQKKVNVNVVAGDGTPEPFSFNPKTNQQVSTVVESDSIGVIGINMPTSISIVGGQYSINNGAWSTSAGTINPTDFIKVRLTSSASKETTTTTTLTIGGVSGTFSVTTIPTSVPVDSYLNVEFTFTEPVPQTGSYNQYGVKCTFNHALPTAQLFNIEIQYPSYGGVSVVPYTISMGAGDTEEDSGYIITDADPTGALITGTLTASTLANGSVVEDSTGTQRIVNMLTVGESFVN